MYQLFEGLNGLNLLVLTLLYMQSQFTEVDFKFGWSTVRKIICHILMDVELFYKNVGLQGSFCEFPNSLN